MLVFLQGLSSESQSSVESSHGSAGVLVVSGFVIVTPGWTDGQLQTGPPRLGEGDGGVEGRGLGHGHVEVGWSERLPGAEAGQSVDTLPPLTLLLESPLLGDDRLVVRQLLPGLGRGQLAQHLRQKTLVRR